MIKHIDTKIRVLGIDCGIAITGWSIVERAANDRDFKVIDYGIIKTESKIPMQQRLSHLYHGVVSILDEYKPDQSAVETLYYFKNQKTIISVGQARGVVLLALHSKKLPIYDYTPLQVKQAVVGYGKATKDQVQKMVKTILKLKSIPKPDDAADALGIVVCHFHSQYR
jgi:crossover junction endodeoxyribonuclease RuvC